MTPVHDMIRWLHRYAWWQGLCLRAELAPEPAVFGVGIEIRRGREVGGQQQVFSRSTVVPFELLAKLDCVDCRGVLRMHVRHLQALLDDDERRPAPSADRCDRPPPGWRCTRSAGHDGPCAALPADWTPEPPEQQP